MVWARAEIYARLECELDSLAEGLEVNDETFDEFDRRRLAAAVKQIRRALFKKGRAVLAGPRIAYPKTVGSK